MTVIAKKYYTVTEAADLLGLTTQRVRQLIQTGQIVAEKAHDRLWIVAVRELERFQNVDRPAGVHVDKRS